MGISPESIQIGRCYLTATDYVRRVVQVMPDGRVVFEVRASHVANTRAWRSGILDAASFASSALREVPCEWMPEGNDHPRADGE